MKIIICSSNLYLSKTDLANISYVLFGSFKFITYRSIFIMFYSIFIFVKYFEIDMPKILIHISNERFFNFIQKVLTKMRFMYRYLLDTTLKNE